MAGDRFYRNVQIATGTVAVLWLVHLVNIILTPEFRYFGLVPGRVEGLRGILFAPFLHANIQHLMSNSGVLLVLLLVSLSYSRKMTAAALAVIILAGGAAVWLFGTRNTIHIGASGVIFGLIGFLLFIGVFQRRWKPLLISIAVFFAYGGILFSLFIYMPGVSWSSHFWGFASGVLAAWGLRSSEAHAL